MNILDSIDYQPFIIGFDGSKYWYKNGDLHRDDGPAYEGVDGGKGSGWWQRVV